MGALRAVEDRASRSPVLSRELSVSFPAVVAYPLARAGASFLLEPGHRPLPFYVTIVSYTT